MEKQTKILLLRILVFVLICGALTSILIFTLRFQDFGRVDGFEEAECSSNFIHTEINPKLISTEAYVITSYLLDSKGGFVRLIFPPNPDFGALNLKTSGQVDGWIESISENEFFTCFIADRSEQLTLGVTGNQNLLLLLVGLVGGLVVIFLLVLFICCFESPLMEAVYPGKYYVLRNQH